MYFTIDHHSGAPVSAQIIEQMKYRVVSGAIAAGEKLPSVRALAKELNLNPTTVSRVYRQLESDGIIYTQPGSGTFVSGRPPGLTKVEQQRRLAPSIREIVVEAGRLGVDYDSLMDWISKEIQAIRERKESIDE